MHSHIPNVACRQTRCLLSCYFASAKLRPEKTDALLPTLFFRLKCKISPFLNVLNMSGSQKTSPQFLPEKKAICILFSILVNFSLFTLINHWINKNDYI